MANFSIVNGGQTSYVLHRSEHIDKHHSFWLPCKIIKIVGKTIDEKNAFSLAIAQATNPEQLAKICKELLYIYHYFDKVFQPKFESESKNSPNASDKIPLANKSRTICVAFTALAARYHQKNLTDKDITSLISSPTSPEVYKMLRNLGDMKFLLPIKLYTDAYKAALDKLFKEIIKAGTKNYSMERRRDPNLTANSFLQSDKNYYDILKDHWDDLKDTIQETFANV